MLEIRSSHLCNALLLSSFDEFSKSNFFLQIKRKVLFQIHEHFRRNQFNDRKSCRNRKLWFAKCGKAKKRKVGRKICVLAETSIFFSSSLVRGKKSSEKRWRIALHLESMRRAELLSISPRKHFLTLADISHALE